jgi:uncharacterized membrane protein (DUF441 family)
MVIRAGVGVGFTSVFMEPLPLIGRGVRSAVTRGALFTSHFVSAVIIFAFVGGIACRLLAAWALAYHTCRGHNRASC